MNKFKKVFFTSVFALPLLANAASLTITNNTKNDLSFRINNICSKKIDGFGMIPVNTMKTISEKGLERECKYNPSLCVAFVYNNANCKDESIAEIGLASNYGIIYVGGLTRNDISISATQYTLKFKAA